MPPKRYTVKKTSEKSSSSTTPPPPTADTDDTQNVNNQSTTASSSPSSSSSTVHPDGKRLVELAQSDNIKNYRITANIVGIKPSMHYTFVVPSVIPLFLMRQIIHGLFGWNIPAPSYWVDQENQGYVQSFMIRDKNNNIESDRVLLMAGMLNVKNVKDEGTTPLCDIIKIKGDQLLHKYQIGDDCDDESIGDTGYNVILTLERANFTEAIPPACAPDPKFFVLSGNGTILPSKCLSIQQYNKIRTILNNPMNTDRDQYLDWFHIPQDKHEPQHAIKYIDTFSIVDSNNRLKSVLERYGRSTKPTITPDMLDKMASFISSLF